MPRCDDVVSHQLAQKYALNPVVPCPPCVAELEEVALAAINELQDEVDDIKSGGSESILTNWLFNT